MQELDMDVPFEEIYNNYVNEETKEGIQKQINKFYKYLFGEDGSNLASIFRYKSLSRELYVIHWMLSHDYYAKTHLLNLLIHKSPFHDALCKIIYDIQKSHNYNSHVLNIINDINTIINTKILIQQFKMDASFEEIYNSYNNAKENNDDVERKIQITKFCQYLFGNNCCNLRKILYFTSYEEVIAINYMLRENYVKNYVKIFLKDNIILPNVFSKIKPNNLYVQETKKHLSAILDQINQDNKSKNKIMQHNTMKYYKK